MLTHAPGRHISAPLTVTNVETTKECTSCIPLVNDQTPLLPPLILNIPSTMGQVRCSNRPLGTLPTSAQRPSHADLHQLGLTEQIIRDLHVKRELMRDLGLYIQCLESMKRTLDEYQRDLKLSSNTTSDMQDANELMDTLGSRIVAHQSMRRALVDYEHNILHDDAREPTQ